MINRNSGFWIRFIARLFDLVAVSAIAITSAYFMMEHNGIWIFKPYWLYYIWTLEFVVLTFTWFIIVPIFAGGSTLFMWLFRIKIIFDEKNKFTSMIKRELFFSINWILMSIIMALIVNHTLISEFARTNNDKIILTNFEKIRTGIVTAIGTVMMVIQFIYIISIIVRAEKKGLHDTQSKTQTVWKNKFIKIPVAESKITITPKPVNNNPVIWVD